MADPGRGVPGHQGARPRPAGTGDPVTGRREPGHRTTGTRSPDDGTRSSGFTDGSLGTNRSQSVGFGEGYKFGNVPVSDMPISGYDPDDLDDALGNLLSRSDVEEFLTDDEIDRWESGESLLDLLDDEELERLLDESQVEVE